MIGKTRALCGNCGRNATPLRNHKTLKEGKKEEIYYQCNIRATLYKCPGCHTLAKTVDDEAWKRALEIIHDPSKVDKALEEQKSKYPTASRREQIDKKLAENRTRQKNLRKNHMKASEEGELDRETIEEYTLRVKQLKQEEQQIETERAEDDKIHQKW